MDLKILTNFKKTKELCLNNIERMKELEFEFIKYVIMIENKRLKQIKIKPNEIDPPPTIMTSGETKRWIKHYEFFLVIDEFENIHGFSTIAKKPFLGIKSLFIVKPLRKQGFGKQLINEMRKKHPKQTISISCLVDNVVACNIYEKMELDHLDYMITNVEKVDKLIQPTTVKVEKHINKDDIDRSYKLIEQINKSLIVQYSFKLKNIFKNEKEIRFVYHKEKFAGFFYYNPKKEIVLFCLQPQYYYNNDVLLTIYKDVINRYKIRDFILWSINFINDYDDTAVLPLFTTKMMRRFILRSYK